MVVITAENKISFLKKYPTALSKIFKDLEIRNK